MTQFDAALDLSYPVLPIAADLLTRWAPTIKTRIEKGGTSEVDLTALLFDLWRMRAVINLPTYARARVRQETTPADTWLSSEENRHGTVEGLVSNSKVFAFSVLMRDFNVVSRQTVGAPRSFMLCGLDGELRDGWESIEVVGPENADIPDNLDVFGMVYPGRWVSFYGAPYLLAKTLIMRLEAENKAFRMVRKALQANGVLPPPERWPAKGSSKEDTETLLVPAFAAELDGIDFRGEHPYFGNLKDLANMKLMGSPPRSEDAVRRFTEDGRDLYNTLNALKFLTRATEKAFFDYQILKYFEDVENARSWVCGEQRDVRLPPPSWCNEWEVAYRKVPRARTRWARLEVGDGIFLRFRTWLKKERVRKMNGGG